LARVNNLTADKFHNNTVKLMIILLVFIHSFISVSCRQDAQKEESLKEETVNSSDGGLAQGDLTFYDENGKELTSIVIEIAADDYSRSFGLMFREKLPFNQGMLFVFDNDEIKYFWMKNTPLPLDMIFVNGDKEIVKIHKNTKPFSVQTYSSEKKARYVVEVNAGFTDSFGIGEGCKIAWKKF
jgi:uncharacterized membrane protein (UPF0127 family)